MLCAVWVPDIHQTTKPQIIGWGVSGKFLEIPNKMRLVMVLELVCNPRPINGSGGIDTRQNVGKPIEAAQLFWCRSDHLLELHDEMLLAHSHTLTEFANR